MGTTLRLDTDSSVFRANDGVNTKDLVPGLKAALQKLGIIHYDLFGTYLTVTSGKDAIHSTGSLHGEGKAFDFRTKDKSELENLVMLLTVLFLAPKLKIAAFDERTLPGEPHVHVEYHG